MFDYKQKESNVTTLNEYTLLKTLSMFNYKNLPSTLNPIFIERQLQTVGYVFITTVNGELYAFNGSLGGELDVYGQPTKISIASPALNFTKTLDIQNDGVLLQNNDLRLPLLPIIERHNTLLVENEITMFIATYNARIQTLISAADDRTKASAEIYLEKIVAGELGVIGENQMFDGIKSQNTTVGSTTDLIKIVEFHQYIKASLSNEIGLNANFNMKRERINEKEVELNTDALYPLIDNLLLSRVSGVAALNDMFGLNVEVDFGSIWKDKTSAGTSEIMGHDETETGANENEILDDEKTEH